MSKQKKIENFQKGILQFLRGRGYRPLRSEELQEALDLPSQLTPLFETALEQLTEQGRIRKGGGRYLLAESRTDVAIGILKLHPRGFAFLVPDDRESCPSDVFIPRGDLGGAVDGDRVEVTVSPSRKEGKGPEGEVIRIIERMRERVSGIVTEAWGNGGRLLAPLLGPDHELEIASEDHLRKGDRVVVSISDWGSGGFPSEGVVERQIGHISDARFDVEAALAQFEIRSAFSKEALLEAKSHGTRVGPKAMHGRVDLREEVAITIDPASAKDFDDALSLHIDGKGHFHLSVHIADVSHYVQSGSALDVEAKERCNSTYFPGRCVPMLPPELCDNLCSLKPDVNRLAVTVVMELGTQAELLNYRIERTVIRSKQRFSYEEAKDILDGKKKSQYGDLLRQMERLCCLLKKQRKSRGTVEFALPEVVLEVNKRGEPTGTRTVEYDITHQMVEEFMLKANEVVATDLARKGRGLTYRIHEEPEESAMSDFAALASLFGFALSDKPAPEELQELFERAKATPHGTLLAVAYIRSMKLASYSPDNIGHYGLSLEHYCHFTSPIRRYADLVVHRALLETEEIDEGDLAKISSECSERERVSARAEQSVSVLKKLRLLEKSHLQNRKRRWKAVVTKIHPFGLFFELEELMLDGFLHISKIGPDYYLFDEKEGSLRGERSRETLQCGTPITVSLRSIDLIKNETEWNRIAIKGQKT